MTQTTRPLMTKDRLDELRKAADECVEEQFKNFQVMTDAHKIVLRQMLESAIELPGSASLLGAFAAAMFAQFHYRSELMRVEAAKAKETADVAPV